MLKSPVSYLLMQARLLIAVFVICSLCISSVYANEEGGTCRSYSCAELGMSDISVIPESCGTSCQDPSCTGSTYQKYTFSCEDLPAISCCCCNCGLTPTPTPTVTPTIPIIITTLPIVASPRTVLTQ